MIITTQYANLNDQDVIDLITYHFKELRKSTPEEFSFVLNIDKFKQPNIQLWSAYIDQDLAGICALQLLDSTHAELKTMRTHPNYLKQGVAQALLDVIITNAKSKGVEQISLETGTQSSFDAAIALYQKNGFRKGEAFSDYTDSPFNQFFYLIL